MIKRVAKPKIEIKIKCVALDIQKMAKIGILKGKNLKVRNGIDLVTPAEGVSVIEDSSYT